MKKKYLPYVFLLTSMGPYIICKTNIEPIPAEAEREEEHYQAVCNAAKDGDLETLKRLHQESIPLDLTDEDGYQAIHHAARWCRNDVVKTLYVHGASLTAKDKEGNTSYAEARSGNCYDLAAWISKEIQNR